MKEIYTQVYYKERTNDQMTRHVLTTEGYKETKITRNSQNDYVITDHVIHLVFLQNQS